MHLLLRWGGRLAAIAALTAPPLAAQRVTPATYAITNARIVPVAGPAIEKGTIVIRDGLIAAVGAAVTVPADARTIDGSGHTVYPGLIDGYSTLGLRAAAAPAGGGGFGGFGAPAPTRPAGAPNSNAPIGLQPEIRAIDQVIDNTDFATAHAAGFAAALTAPQGRIYEGQSALITLKTDDFGAVAVRPTVALQIGFQGLGGGTYPGSLMGVFAALRQSLLDAQHYRDQQAAYAKAPRTMARPAYDPSLDALQPVIAGTMPVIFRVSTQREIERALDLAKEFKLKAMIGGGSEAFRVADRLKTEGVPVLLSMSFPRRTAAPAADAEPEPLRLLRERVQAPKTPGELQKAGVRIALQAGGNYTDFLANLRRAVAGGLSADDAVRAATLTTAELFGVADRLGSIEVGKIANLTVVRGADLLAADARVTAVWVDGRPNTVAPPTAIAGARGPGARPGLEGAWQMQVELDGVERVVALALREEDGRLRGAITGDLGAADVSDVLVEANGDIAFVAVVTTTEGTEEAWFRGTLTRGVFAGRVEIVGHATGKFAGLRQNTGSTTDRTRERQEER
ncbi:MAG: amidohydrolase family protein [Gemmatimonadaceae bacterium]|nr:amidohydrolase family protein [Gemmatimonadaceae bacterium]